MINYIKRKVKNNNNENQLIRIIDKNYDNSNSGNDNNGNNVIMK